MTDPKTPDELKSLYKMHLQILGLDKQVASTFDATTKEEYQTIESQALPPLVLPVKRKLGSFSSWTFALAAAAALAVIVIPKNRPAPEDSSYVMKGQSQIQVFRKRGETVDRLLPGQKSESGDQIRVSLTAGQTGIAYLSYFDKENSPLVALDSFLKAGQKLAPGAKIEFPGSVKLVGANVGEKVVVLICSDGGKQAIEALGVEEVKKELQKALESRASPGVLNGYDCWIYTQSLR